MYILERDAGIFHEPRAVWSSFRRMPVFDISGKMLDRLFISNVSSGTGASNISSISIEESHWTRGLGLKNYCTFETYCTFGKLAVLGNVHRGFIFEWNSGAKTLFLSGWDRRIVIYHNSVTTSMDVEISVT